MNFRFLVSFLVAFIFSFQSAFAEYKVTENMTKAWQALFDLDFATAKDLVQKELKENPKNYYAYYVDQHIDAYLMMINASQEDYENFIKQFEFRRSIMDNQNIDSPYYQLCEAEMQLQMGIFNVIYGDRITGIRRAYGAYNKFYKAQKEHPDFIYNKKMIGMFNIALSNLPPFVKYAANTFGISGDYDTGFKIMNQYLHDVKDIKGINTEAALYIILGYKLNKEPEKAFQFLQSIDTSIINYRLLKYFYANVAWASGRNNQAINLLSEFKVEELKSEFLPYNYMAGKMQMRNLDKQAEINFLYFLRKTKREGYLKEINYYLAQYYLINGDLAKFQKYKQLASEKGNEVTERDRETTYDCQLDYVPNPTLVKGKLLMDGGYTDRFKKNIENFRIENETPLPYKLEYYLLMGRYFEQKKSDQQAIDSYKKVIASGSDSDYYFASEAALRLGMYYENKNKELSLTFYNEALDLYDSEYYEYIKELATKGIGRLNIK